MFIIFLCSFLGAASLDTVLSESLSDMRISSFTSGRTQPEFLALEAASNLYLGDFGPYFLYFVKHCAVFNDDADKCAVLVDLRKMLESQGEPLNEACHVLCSLRKGITRAGRIYLGAMRYFFQKINMEDCMDHRSVIEFMLYTGRASKPDGEEGLPDQKYWGFIPLAHCVLPINIYQALYNELQKLGLTLASDPRRHFISPKEYASLCHRFLFDQSKGRYNALQAVHESIVLMFDYLRPFKGGVKVVGVHGQSYTQVADDLLYHYDPFLTDKNF